MLLDSFDFFVDIGNKVNVFGLNLWQVSLIVFVVSVLGRFLFPFVFGESGRMFLEKGEADSYKDDGFYLAPYKEKRSSLRDGSNSAGMLGSGK